MLQRNRWSGPVIVQCLFFFTCIRKVLFCLSFLVCLSLYNNLLIIVDVNIDIVVIKLTNLQVVLLNQGTKQELDG